MTTKQLAIIASLSISVLIVFCLLSVLIANQLKSTPAQVEANLSPTSNTNATETKIVDNIIATQTISTQKPQLTPTIQPTLTPIPPTQTPSCNVIDYWILAKFRVEKEL